MAKDLLDHSLKAFVLYFVCLCIEKSDAAYFPNYGYVGCYNYTNQMERFIQFNVTSDNVSESSSVHNCIQICLKQYNNKYAGLMAGARCFCGDKYNQTFATNEAHCNLTCADNEKCEGYGKMTIYNTDYDVKLLFSIPGNNTKFLEAWNRKVTMKFGNMFTKGSMRSQAIDWWNQGKLYHRPEYVSMMAFNEHGQLLWAINFFTNDTNANIANWMKKDRVLPNEFLNSSLIDALSISINANDNEIDITESGLVWFRHGNVNKDKARVTVVSPKRKPLPVSYSSSLDRICTYAVDGSDRLVLGCYFSPEKKKCDCSNMTVGNCMQYSCYAGYLTQWIQGSTGCCCPVMKWCINGVNNCKEYSLIQNNEGTCVYNLSYLLTKDPNYEMTRVRKFETTFIKDGEKYVSDIEEQKFICGINLTISYKLMKLRMKITNGDEEIITIEMNLRNGNGMKWFQTCIRTPNMTIYVQTDQQQLSDMINLTLYEPTDDQILMVDRIPVLGFHLSYNDRLNRVCTYAVNGSGHLVLGCYLPIEKKECNCSKVTDGNCMRYFWHGNAVCPLHWISGRTGCCHCCPWMRCCINVVRNLTAYACTSKQSQRTCVLNPSHLLTQEPNYGMRRVRVFENDGEKYVSDTEEKKFFCGINLTDSFKSIKLRMEIDDDEEIITIEIDLPDDIGMFWFKTCIRIRSMTIYVPTGQLKKNPLTLYELADDALLMVDRIAVLGFYHKEEPKISKWEFLNDYPPEEVLNIMRPVLQKTKSSGEVAVKNLSSSIRKKESAIDYRKSSEGIGILGGCLLGFVFLIIFVSDIFIIKAHLKAMFRNISRLFRLPANVRVHSEVD